MNLQIQVDAREVVTYFEQATAQALAKLNQNHEQIGIKMQGHVRTEHLSGQTLQRRTGAGSRAIFYRVDAGENAVTTTVGADLSKAKYMRAQEMGATIRAIRSRYLTVPLEAAKTAGGVARFTARDVISEPGRYGFTGTFFRDHVLFGKRGKTIVPLFALKASITLKPTGYLTKSLGELQAWAVAKAHEGIPA